MREQTALVERATERLVADLLPVLDSFDGALGSFGPVDTPEQEKVRNGVLGIHAQLVGVLQKAGLARIDSDGAGFDPNQHEAVMQDDGAGEPRVAETLRTGYRLKDRVLRPAMVRVTRA
jgi:molecular chaperone GrpE